MRFAFALLALVATQVHAQSKFDGKRAMEYVRKQLAFGPRIPGTSGHREAGDWIVQQMRQRADTVIEQTWTHTTEKHHALPMRNVLARFKPAATERVLYVAHWDSRPFADRAEDPMDRHKPVPGANDGASGVAVLLALADVLKETPPHIGVDLLFVDGEDYGSFDTNTDVLIGSNYFAKHLPDSSYRPLFGVVWDMVGDRELRLAREGHSVKRAPDVVRRVWEMAASLGHGDIFVSGEIEGITDDHIPLLDRGLQVIDVIDLDYPSMDTDLNFHHTPFDTIDKLSVASLQAVGDVALALIAK
jgi:glutaminyl-peptide cyclotransferase